MVLLLWLLLFLARFALLVKGAQLLVGGASHLAYALGVTPLCVGLTIVSFGTSATEVTINLLAARVVSADIAVGNVLGSRIANLALILGPSAVVRPVRVESAITVCEIPFLFLTSLALLNQRVIHRGEGVLLGLGYAGYLTLVARRG